MIKKTISILILLYLFYKLDVVPIVVVVQHLLVYWNIFMYTILTLKDNHPVIYMLLPFILIWLLLQKNA